MGGGGANSLDSPKIGENSDFKSDKSDNDLNDNEPNDIAKQEDIISEYTYKTYEDYFNDLNITAETITEEDLTGSGTVTDPYLCHSTRGFLWLTNYGKSKIYLHRKYFELGCDIILNDEAFDENGTPSGGDGVIYEWSPISDCDRPYINGNGFSITGLFIDEPTQNNLGLFSSGLLEFNNVQIENVYINGNENIATITSAYLVFSDNVHILSGNLYGKKNIYGISLSTNEMTNSSNRANIEQTEYTTSGSFAGLVAEVSVSIENCKNYGNLNVLKGSYAGGLVFGALEMIGCANYGNITLKSGGSFVGVGGLCGLTQGNVKIISSTNYGEILNPLNLNVYIGGIVGYLYSKAEIRNCENYGYCLYASGLSGGGYISTYQFINCKNFGTIENGNCLVKGLGNNYKFVDCEVDCSFINCVQGILFGTIGSVCEVYGLEMNVNITGSCTTPYFGLIGYLNPSGGVIVEDLDCSLNFKETSLYENGICTLLVFVVRANQSVTLNNTIFNIESDSSIKKRCILVMYFEGGNVDLNNFEINCKYENGNSMSLFWAIRNEGVNVKNIIVREKLPSATLGDVVYNAGDYWLKETLNGVIREIETNSKVIKVYYGTDFSDFYCNWKTGKVGLKSLSGKGFYQGKVSEEWLVAKGFEKKEIA